MTTAACDCVQVAEIIQRIDTDHAYVVDPHTAVGIGAAERCKGTAPTIVLSTAHPAKFQPTMERVLGRDVPLPKGTEFVAVLPSSLDNLRI